MRAASCLAAGMTLLSAATVQAAPVSIDITSRSDADGGAYERLVGIAHMTIDPAAAANRGIVDLDHAPRDAQGMVHYDTDVQILRPRDRAKARSVLIYDVVNRGMKMIPSMMSGPGAPAEGDARLMRQGYTIVWSGWQGDLAGSQSISVHVPVATDKGQPITGRITTETIFDNLTSNRITLPYPSAALDQATARLTVREHAGDPEQIIAPADWRYEDERHISVKRPANMDAGAIYRIAYVARDPKVMGLGFPAVRDLIAFLRHGTADQGNPLADIARAPCERDAKGACANPKGGAFGTTIAFGGSQSARYLRDFLWQGFNRDLDGNRVFDGMIPFIPGARRTFTNMRFAEPGRFSRQHEDHDVPGFDFPFTYATLRDPVTGKSDGILARCAKDGTCPKILHIDTSAEFWQAGASLVGTGGTGADVALPATVRAYMIAGGAHAPGMTITACQLAANPLNYAPIIRALLADMVEWTSGRQEPPASRWPRVADGDLVPIDRLVTPDLSSLGLNWPKVVNRPIAPAGTRGWPVLVPRVDADGNDRPGIHMPAMAAPAGTMLGWNPRKLGYAAGDLCLIFGGYVPFAKDAASRGSDPRPSLAERYGVTSREAGLRTAIAALRKDRLLLDKDAEALMPAGN